jgi:transposase
LIGSTHATQRVARWFTWPRPPSFQDKRSGACCRRGSSFFDAHERAFAFFKGACTRGIYDNMKTAVETIFVGKERQYNRRFLQMCAHHLVDPVACTPASGWEKGQVENQVGLVRERFFTPRLRFKTYDEL